MDNLYESKKKNSFPCPYLRFGFNMGKKFILHLDFNEGGRHFVFNIWINSPAHNGFNFFYIAIHLWRFKWLRFHKIWNRR